MGNGEFDTTDASYVSVQQLQAALDMADRVNGKVIRLCCTLYKLAWEAGVDPWDPGMQQAAEVLRQHDCWDKTWDGAAQDGTREQGADEADGSDGSTDQGA